MREFITAVGLLLAAGSSVPALGSPLKNGFANADNSSSIVGTRYNKRFEQPAGTARPPSIQLVTISSRAGQLCAGFRFAYFEEMTNPMRAHRVLTDHIPGSEIDAAALTDDWTRMHYSIEHRGAPGSTFLCSRPAAGLAPLQYVYPHTPSEADLANHDRNEESTALPSSKRVPEPGGGGLLIGCFLGMCAIALRRVYSS